MAQAATSHGVVPHPDQANALSKLKLWAKLAKGELHTITKRDVEDLFGVLDTEERGEISRDDLLVLRQVPDLCLTQEDIENLVNDADKDGSGKVSQDELFKALTQGEIAFNVVLASLGQKKAALKTTECDKEDLIEFLRFEYETNSALWSLPQTLALFIAFFLAVMAHVEQPIGFSMQSALLGEIEGEGAPYLYKYVHDVPTFWDWMESSFSTAHFKSGEGEMLTWPYPGRVASYNQIIGGVQLSRQNSLPGDCSQGDLLKSFYDSRFDGRCHKQADTFVDSEILYYHERRDDILNQLRELRLSSVTNRSWVDQNTTSLDIMILFYNAHLEAFTDHRLTFFFQPDGFVKILFSQETFLADPYNRILWIIPDIIFGLILLRMFYSEMLELVPACMNGLDGFWQYMQFWNVIDWFAIIVGVAVMTLWGMVAGQVITDLRGQIDELNMERLDNAVFANNTYLTTEEFSMVMPKEDLKTRISELHSLSYNIAYLHQWLRQLAFIYNFVLMMKFFKAFKANPRLNIVIKTMQTSATDIVHFLIVFLTIFCVFSSSSYVMFGSKIREFSEQKRSFMMCWRILMGEFDVPAMEAVDWWVANIWIGTFQFLVLLILLNMLLAIIMDTYSAVNEPGAETIWTQIREALHTARETRGHLDMWYLICEFEDEDYQVHPRDRVTSKSLRQAFESQKMTKHNADYLIRKTAEFVKAKEAKSELKISDAVRIISRMQTTTLRTQEAADTILEMMRDERRRPQEERFDAIMAGVDPDTVQHKPRLPALPPPPTMMSQGLALPGAVNDQLQSSNMPTMAGSNARVSTGGSQLQEIQRAAAQRRLSVHSAMEESHRASMMSLSSNVQNTNHRPFMGAAGAAGLPAGGTDQQILAYLENLQTTLDGIRSEQLRVEASLMEELRDTRVYVEQRDAWLEQRLNGLDRRFEKVERASDRVSAGLQGFDFQDLMASMDRITHFLQLKSRGLESDGGPGMRRLSNASDVGNVGSTRFGDPHRPAALEHDYEDEEAEAVGLSWQEQAALEDNHPLREAGLALAPMPAQVDGLGAASKKQMGHQLDRISEQVQQLLSLAEESAESRKLLWKIDLSLRQTRASVQKIEEHGLKSHSPPKTPNRASLSDGFAKTQSMRSRRSTPDPNARGSGLANAGARLDTVPDVLGPEDSSVYE